MSTIFLLRVISSNISFHLGGSHVNIEDTLYRIIRKQSMGRIQPEMEFRGDENLLVDFGFDSIMIVHLYINIEKEFEIEFDDEDIYPFDIFTDIRQLIAAIQGKIK
jgi:acyl carrier protein